MADLKRCPFCGGEVKIRGGQEDWTPTWYDPDSGGDPYFVLAKIYPEDIVDDLMKKLGMEGNLDEGCDD